MEDKARDLRMVFFVRTDLKMPKGKIAAQVGHGVHYLIMDRMIDTLREPDVDDPYHDVFFEWHQGDNVKICLKVASEQELKYFSELGKQLGFPTVNVVDKGYTCFDGQETPTVVGWGPIHKDQHQELTAHLKLL